MGEKNLWSKVGLIVVIVGLSLWQIYPPEENLKQGIDLAGGHSLLFEIDDSGLSQWDKQNLAERMMTILKERVDPQGNRNLVWRPIGTNRLEIQMPKPPDTQKVNREGYEAARDVIADTNITESQIRSALLLPPDQRDAAFRAMSEKVPSRKALFERLAAADETYGRLSAATRPEATTQPGATTQPDGERAREMDKAFVERRQLIEQLLATNIDMRVLGDLLELGRGNETRAKGIAKLKETHPDLAAGIDELVLRHDAWASQKGMLDDPSDLMRLLRGAGVLEFRILAQRGANGMTDSSNPAYNEPIERYIEQLAKRGPRPNAGDKYAWFRVAKSDDDGFNHPSYIVQEYMGHKYVLAHATGDMGLLADRTWTLKSARPGRDQMGRITVDFSLDPRGGARFGQLTSSNIERPLCIFLDDEAISAATIRSQITTNGQISGSFTPQYVQYLVNTLEAGALPARLKEVPLQIKSVGPSLGETNRRRGQQAVIASFLATIAFMAIYYAYNGLIADVALLMNLVITLGVMSFLGATFTLPGIAGLILTLGMAVDANVLIFERMREELQRGVSARMAVKLGYEKAFSAILDGNVTTIITAAILWWIGSEEIKGFGITLGIGLTISMFTALFVTRQYYHIMLPQSLNREETGRAWLMTGILAVAGGAIFAVGWLFHRNDPHEMAESNLVGFGQFLLVLFATSAVLMLSLWAFRYMYRVTGHQKQNRLPMMKLLSAPTIDWMGKYRIFWTVSGVIIGLGMVLTYVGLRDGKLMDIEFVGGTSVQVQLKDQYKDLTDEKVLNYVTGPREDKGLDSVAWLEKAAGALRNAEIKSAGDGRFQISAGGALTQAQLESLLLPTLSTDIQRGGITPAEGGGVLVRLDPDAAAQITTVDAMRQRVASAADYAQTAAGKLRSARVQVLEEELPGGGTRKGFEIITSETSQPIVSAAMLASMSDLIEATQPIQAQLVKDPDRAPDGLFPVEQEDTTLADVIGGNSQESVAPYRGGVVLVFDNLQPAATAADVKQRLTEMRLQPDFEGVQWREPLVLGLERAPGSTGTGDNVRYTRIAIVVNDPSTPYFDSVETWRTEVAQKELSLAEAALASTRSLQRVTQFAPQVASEASQKAIIAVILSLIAIAAYLWIRFGSAEFGVAGILGLYHDVAMGLACVVASHYLYNTFIGRALLLSDFKIDLNIIAALLTIIGFSINDSIVIFDRIRENRGRMATLSTRLVNDSINQTLSRTILTVFTVLIVVVIMYAAGGEGIHGFAFVMVVGTITGSYSTFGISCTMLRHPRVMWIVTAVLVGITGSAVVMMLVDNRKVEAVLIVIVLALTAYGLYRMQKSTVQAGRLETAAV